MKKNIVDNGIEDKKNTAKDEYNVYGSKLSDIDKINQLTLENNILKQVIGDLELEIYKLRNNINC